MDDSSTELLCLFFDFIITAMGPLPLAFFEAGSWPLDLDPLPSCLQHIVLGSDLLKIVWVSEPIEDPKWELGSDTAVV